MPGFLMHLIEGEMIINKINTGVTSAADSHLSAIKAAPEQFLLGCILPDITDISNVFCCNIYIDKQRSGGTEHGSNQML